MVTDPSGASALSGQQPVPVLCQTGAHHQGLSQNQLLRSEGSCHCHRGRLRDHIRHGGKKRMSSPPDDAPIEGCVRQLRAQTTVRLNASATSSPDALVIPVTSESTKDLVLPSLVDSGSSDSFIDSRVVERHHLAAYTIPPVKLRLIDGTCNSMITQALKMHISFPSGETHYITFYVTPLDPSCAIVLGHRWLTQHNPLIDWVRSSVVFRNTPNETIRTPPEVAQPAPEPPAKAVPAPDRSRQTPRVTLLTPAEFARVCKVEGVPVFRLETVAPEVSGRLTTTVPDPSSLNSIPEQYHDFADVFSKAKASVLADHRPYDLKITLEDGTTPPLGPVYSLSQEELKALHKFIDENVATVFITPSHSSHGALVLFIKKKDGSLRLCVDFRGINRITKKDRYPLPLISDLLDAPHKAHIYTKINLWHAYHLVRIATGDEWKTAFHTHYGLLEWKVMPEGLTNAPAGFQRFMNDIFADMIDISIVVYLDDILVYSNDATQHVAHVREVLQRLCKNELYAWADKCKFHTTSCEYLGYMLSLNGLGMSQNKIQAIQDWPEPRKVRDIQSFLGPWLHELLLPFYLWLLRDCSATYAPNPEK